MWFVLRAVLIKALGLGPGPQLRPRRLSRLALLRYEDFRLQLIAWSLDPPASSRPNSAAMTSQLQHHERSLAKIEPSRSNAQSAARATSPYCPTIRRIGSRTALNATRRSAPCWAAPSIPCSRYSIECASRAASTPLPLRSAIALNIGRSQTRKRIPSNAWARKIAAPTKPITAVIVSNIANVLYATRDRERRRPCTVKKIPGTNIQSRSIEDFAQQTCIVL